MVALKDRIAQELEFLPEPKLREVLDFVEFLTWRTAPDEEPLLAVAGILSGDPLSADAIERELYGDATAAHDGM
jgi:hypothetical protein